MCVLCGAKKMIEQAKVVSNNYAYHIQRLLNANKNANKQDSELDKSAAEKLQICETCVHKQVSVIVDTANNLTLPKDTAIKLEKYLDYQCGLCGCSCVLLAYDSIGKPCQKWS